MVQARHPARFGGADALEALLALANSVHVHVEDSCTGLAHCLARLDERVIQTGAKLVIVDSVASLVRKEYGAAEVRRRADLLSSEASQLKYVAEVFGIPVVVTNQITLRFGRGGHRAHVTAALGNTWAHRCVRCWSWCPP